MSLPATAIFWLSLVGMLVVAAGVAFAVGSLYGLFARRTDDETAARGALFVTASLAAVVGITSWVFIPAGLAVTTPLDDERVLGRLFAVPLSALAAGVVSASTFIGLARRYPNFPNVDSPWRAGRRYGRFIAGAFAVALLSVTLAGPAISAGLVGITVFLFALLIGFWIASPIFQSVTTTTRAPTDDERVRLDPLLERVDLEPRGVRVIEGGDRYITVEILGAPGGRVLFVDEAALSSLEDGTLVGTLTARREQAAHYETLVSLVAFVVATIPLLAGVTGTVSLVVGVGTTAVLIIGATALSRRVRWYTDARAADRIGATELADAFEQIADAAGLDLGDPDDRNWLSTRPPLAARIARLRERDGLEAGSDEHHG
ncbi:peptidase [Natronolimnobius sp. AArcel1]|uniref:peptidase n=1 Tax=Natronolimnobius sp. AArcel1 TaxID=1679093 RepID=UPI0013ED04E3|nr:peptidase [Natronolimnobius sp. AArcel1]NGM69358.1 peptidase [Natronolimnobius sp. AArcel1]